jgi:DNA-binding transcriptional MerR regulator
VIRPEPPEDPLRAAWLTGGRRKAWEAWVVDGPQGGAGTSAYNVSQSAAGEPAAQGSLFPESVLADPHGVTDQLLGYRGPAACQIAGITYRQLDYWARTGLVEPSVRAATGSGSQRLYGFRDILVLKVVKRLLDTGISLQQIRAAVAHLRTQGTSDLAQVTLMSDGISVYECTSDNEVVDLVQGGQGVFGIALGRVWQEVEGSLAELPAERAAGAEPDDGATAADPAKPDELSRRRARKTG